MYNSRHAMAASTHRSPLFLGPPALVFSLLLLGRPPTVERRTSAAAVAAPAHVHIIVHWFSTPRLRRLEPLSLSRLTDGRFPRVSCMVGGAES